ncbi:polyketide biosynthesis cytochrome P450 PksS [Reticulibacter mediterranei]|uniref:Polyketide biosynthesis cytochrome P450 PksS n=1 Tax=Reticulibacter mediterranei TaxID=2778369 RepID=A0A8J3MXL0_9CHLR|nr:cytochrome P450 [Reticulibacter mediterranei]GHO91089.1 polyketide biosynthesis cytochrome P450 PksS [Reticulibacter mediterranei]
MTQTNEYQLGQEYHPLQEEQLENPYRLYGQMREKEPITFSPELGAWLITRYKDMRSVLSQPEIFSSRDVKNPVTALSPAALAVLMRGYPMLPISIDSDGLNHQRFRQPHLQGLAPARLAPYEDFIRALVNRLIDTFIDDRQAELLEQFAYPLPLEVMFRLFNIPQERMAETKQWCLDLVDLLYGNLTEERQVECAKSVVAFQHYIAEFVNEQRKNPKEDLIGFHITHQTPGADPLSLEELIAVICGFIMAGHRTTVDLIGNGLVLLLQPNTRWQKLSAHPELIRPAIEEVLRYDSPVHALFRTTTREVKIENVLLPQGARLLLLFGSANRDEEQFPNAHLFEMERHPNHHLGFSYGPHFCAGAPLARMEVRIAFEVLSQRIPNLRLKSGQKLTRTPVLAFRGYQKIEAEW